MSGPQPALKAGGDELQKASGRNLPLRVASAILLAPLAIGAAYLGGWVFTGFWTIAALAVWWEWGRMVEPAGSWAVFVTGAGAIVAEAVLAGTGHFAIALSIALLGAPGAAATATKNYPWIAGGVLYAGALLIAPVFIRSQAETGFLSIIFLFAVVWATDTFGYFVGRAAGGPKLAPSISPKKTWSGAFGGLLGAIIAALAVASAEHHTALFPVAIMAIVLSIVAQAGDLFESKVKRVFEAKDTSGLIPGHGGVMDRLDGFLVAAVALALIGVVRASVDAPTRGFVIW